MGDRRLEVLFLEPFDGGSHRAFARGWVAHSRHRIHLKTLPPRFWKWRLRGAAFTFAEMMRTKDDRHHRSAGRAAESHEIRSGYEPIPYDAIVASSMMNAADFLAAARWDRPMREVLSAAPRMDRTRSASISRTRGSQRVLGTGYRPSRIPLIVYFHENQLSYPRPPDEPLDHGLALASLSSAAAADSIVFNSRFHRDAFFEGLGDWLKRFPEHAPRRTAAAIRKKSRVIPPGIDWQAMAPLALRSRASDQSEMSRRASMSVTGIHGKSRYRDSPMNVAETRRRSPGRPSSMAPLILWNHRWEFDKNPSAFFSAMEVLAARGWPFRLALLGENTQFVPKPFLAARERFGPRIVQFGYVPSTTAYRGWLKQADIVVSTAKQENFGIAVAEAIAAGAFPVLPARLSYPEVLPRAHHAACLYRGQADLIHMLERLLGHPERLAAGRRARSLSMRRYDWSAIAERLDDLVGELVEK